MVGAGLFCRVCADTRLTGVGVVWRAGATVDEEGPVVDLGPIVVDAEPCFVVGITDGISNSGGRVLRLYNGQPHVTTQDIISTKPTLGVA